MSPETRAFLDSVRDAEDPSSDDQRRVLSGVRAALAAGAIGMTASNASAAAAKAQPAWSLVGGLKLAGVLAGVMAAVAAVGWAAGFLPFSSDFRPSPGSAAAPLQRPPAAPEAPPASAAVPPPPAPAAVVSSEAPKRVVASRKPQLPSLREEIELLAEVTRALERGDGAAALARLDGHVSADRQLLAERQAARIKALCLLGRGPEARAAAVEFLRVHPTSVQREGIERSCASSGK
jgi:hypothetical protein